MQKKTKRKIKRIIHNGILGVLSTIAGIGFIGTSFALAELSGRELGIGLCIYVVCFAWIAAVVWANKRLGNC